MSVQSQRLAELILKEHFGDIVAKIGVFLLKNGSRNLKDITSRLKLSKANVQKSLVVLIQHGIVDGPPTAGDAYRLDFQKILAWLCYPKFVALVKVNYSEVEELIFEELLKSGQSLMSQVVQNVAQRLEQNGLTDKTPEVLCEMIKAGFQKLVQSSYITLVPKEKSPSEQSPSQVIATTSSVEASVPFLSASQLQGITYRKRGREEEAEDEQSEAKKTKTNELDPVDAGMYWKINTTRLTEELKSKMAVSAASRKVDAVAGNILEAVFQYALHHIPFKEVYFTDVLKQLQESRKVHLSEEQVEQYMKILCEENLLKRTGDGSGGTYNIETKRINHMLCQSALEALVRERFGNKHHRIFRLIILKKYLDQKQISDMAMVPQKEAKEMLYTLLAEHFVTIQEIPRSQDYAPARTFYFFTYNQQQVASMVMERCYKGMANLMILRKTNQDQNRRLLDRQASYEKQKMLLEQQGAGQEELQELEETFTPDERKTVERLHKVIAKLDQAELKLAESIMVINSWLNCQ